MNFTWESTRSSSPRSARLESLKSEVLLSSRFIRKRIRAMRAGIVDAFGPFHFILAERRGVQEKFLRALVLVK